MTLHTRAQTSEETRLIEALNQQLLADGVISQLPNPAEDIDDDDPDDQPIEIMGEPLSETIIRERHSLTRSSPRTSSKSLATVR